ncbi:hypothetical protein ACFL9S_17545 [Erwinia sp. AnSW2-5]|uniref:hypothetical protein n=1 Tax=Erwinia sp. AnSW2-5 TaxID=3367692 RepID=UPI00385B53ED
MEKLNNPLARGVSYLLIWLTAVQPALAGALSTHTPNGIHNTAHRSELVYCYNMTEQMLEKFALDQQLDQLAAERGDAAAGERVSARRDALAAAVIVGSGGIAAVAGGMIIAAAAPELLLAARLALTECKASPVLCLHQAGIYATDMAAPEAALGTGSLAAGGTLLVGKSQDEVVQFGKQIASAGIPVFKGATEADVMAYFRRLAGVEIMPAAKIIPGKGTVYSVKVSEGPDAGSRVTLRDFTDSAEKTKVKWIIDIKKTKDDKGNGVEIKFQ